MQKKVQAAVEIVELWTNKWAFGSSVTKSQVICFSRHYKSLSLKLYDQTLEQVRVVRFLGVLLDEKLTWRQHIDKVKTKYKKVKLLYCLSGWDWGEYILGPYESCV